MSVITISNFKGGVGKTTASVLFSYLLQEQGKKVLLIDLDPQANASKFIYKTFQVKPESEFSLFESIQEQDLSKVLMSVTPNLDLLPSDLDLTGFPLHLYSLTKDVEKRPYFLSFLLEKLQKETDKSYDYIIIDVPPTISEFTNNAFVASDFILLIMQTHIDSYEASVQMIDYMKDIKKFNANIDLIGVVPYLVYERGTVDKKVLASAKKKFDNLLFENQIMSRERVKGFKLNGIKNEDMHDKAVLEMFQNVLNELIERIEK